MNVHGLVTSPVLTVNDIVSYKILASNIVTTVLCHIISCLRGILTPDPEVIIESV